VNFPIQAKDSKTIKMQGFKRSIFVLKINFVRSKSDNTKRFRPSVVLNGSFSPEAK
jgi:hypothetical protein